MKSLKSILCSVASGFIMLLATTSALAQSTRTVSGQVLDSDGLPLIGAAVVVPGTTSGTITDVNGNYSINVPADATQLSFSFIGFTTQNLAIPGNTLNVTMVSDAELLGDVVVVGYGTARKSDMTGSVTAIKPDEKNRGLVTNAQDMMTGKIAGVNVTSDGGTPGGGATIRVRGGSSLNASNDPLIVIDGLAMDNQGVKGLSNPLSMVNPADIETFTVLKDASATAIYGSRGSNGVIIITTKKGAKGKAPQFAYNGNVSVSNKKKTLDVMTGDEYREFVRSTFDADSEGYAALGTANTDWQEEIYRTAISHDHNVTMTGGIPNMGYRVSVGYTGQQGILDTSDFKRFTAALNLSPSFLEDHLSFNINVKGMYAKSQYANTAAVGAAVWFDPTQPVRSDDEKFANYAGYWQWVKAEAFGGDATWPYSYNAQATKNPVSLLDLTEDIAKSKSVVGNVEGTYKVHGFEDLIAHANFGFDFSTGRQETVTQPSSPSNVYYGWDGWEEIDKYNLQFNAYLMYNKDFNDANHFDIMAGYEYQHFHHEKDADGWGTYPESAGEDLAGQTYGRSTDSEKSENFLVSFFGRMNYSLLNRYLLTATVRYDGSSRFNDHWALFPSVALGWKFKEESFLKDAEWLSDGKLRLGYGQTGQQEGIGDYNYITSFTASSGARSAYPLVSESGLMYRPDAINKDLTWETTETYNIGLDLGFLHDRLVINADYYYRETTDLINTVSVPAGSNFKNTVTSNIGSLENTGVEVAVTARPVQRGEFNWELTANFTYNENEITELIGGDEDYYVETGGISSGTGNNCQAHAVGHAANTFHVYQQIYGEDGLPIEGLYVDRNADGIINQSDLYYYKNPNAPVLLGLSSRMQWKKFDFSFSLRASIGNYVFNDTKAGMANVSTGGVYTNSYLGNRTMEAVKNNWQTFDNALSDYFVENASFLKCDNITLGWSFDQIASAKISGRVFGAVSNVFTITEYDGIDPEVSGGIDNNIYPRPITALVGLSLNF